jgi:hypothetical protein
MNRNRAEANRDRVDVGIHQSHGTIVLQAPAQQVGMSSTHVSPHREIHFEFAL